VAASARRGLAAAKAAPPDLVLLDVNLPDGDGYSVCASLKSDPATYGVPVIFISALDGALDKVRAFEAGGVDYVTKPFEAAEMSARVENQLRVSRLQKELERRNAELVKSREEALAASRAKSAFLATMSHELRTPLNAVLGFVQLMERDPNLTDTQRENLDIISRSGEHLLSLINDVLLASKIGTGEATLAPTPFDVRRTITALAEVFSIRAADKGLTFRVEYDEALPPFVVGDRQKLRQVLVNLLDNAVKFTDRGEVVLRVAWTDDVASFEVLDTGSGIGPDELPHVFETFTQSSSGRALRQGAGLGLAIARDFVRHMGGTLTGHSEVDRGSRFVVTVPLPRSSVSPPSSVDEDGEAGQPAVMDRAEMQARLAKLPSPVIHGLRKAVTLGDLEIAADHVEAAAVADVELADDLRRLVRGYQLDRLFDLLDGL
jgi:signal transduction histidine kinase